MKEKQTPKEPWETQEIIVKAKPHFSRKVVFAELFAEVLAWGESVGLSHCQMTMLLEGFREKTQ